VSFIGNDDSSLKFGRRPKMSRNFIVKAVVTIRDLSVVSIVFNVLSMSSNRSGR